MLTYPDKKKIRILQISPEFPPYFLGGGGLFVKNLSKKLSQQGHSVTVISGCYVVKGFLDHPFSVHKESLRVEWLPLLPTPKIGFQLKTIMPPNLRSFIRLIKIFQSKDFDVVHIHGFGHPICDYASILCRIIGINYLLTIHGFPKEPMRRGGILRLLFNAYSASFGASVIKNADVTIAVSESLAHECLAYVPKEKIEVIQNAIELQKYLTFPIDDTVKISKKYGLDGKTVMLCIGRLSEAKGFQYAIQAIGQIKAKIPNAHLVIVGKDDGYGYLQELKRLTIEGQLEPDVSFVGGVSDEEKIALLWLSRVVIIPSIEEVFGIVALEAMATGRPIVASKIGGLKEVLSNDEYSVLVNCKDVEQLALAIINTIQDQKIASEAIDNRLSRVKRFDLDETAKKYANLYLKTISKNIG
jgi:glycosyltransferase involved in cell wall biosynthesis